jgi:hypothetical protein
LRGSGDDVKDVRCIHTLWRVLFLLPVVCVSCGWRVGGMPLGYQHVENIVIMGPNEGNIVEVGPATPGAHSLPFFVCDGVPPCCICCRK